MIAPPEMFLAGERNAPTTFMLGHTTMEQAAQAAAAKPAKQSEFRPGGGLPSSVD